MGRVGIDPATGGLWGRGPCPPLPPGRPSGPVRLFIAERQPADPGNATRSQRHMCQARSTTIRSASFKFSERAVVHLPRQVGCLTGTHVMADLSTGAVPALLPFLVIEGHPAAPRSLHPGRVGSTQRADGHHPAVSSPPSPPRAEGPRFC